MTIQESLDNVLVQVGEMGRYQIFVLSLISMVVLIQSAIHIAFVFTAQNINYRCRISECDRKGNVEFEPPWIKYAVPYKDGKPKGCERYRFINGSDQFCAENSFDSSIIENCGEYVYADEGKSILHQFEDMHCERNLWKFTLVGTVNTAAQFFSLQISGIVSDKFGRKFTMIWGLTIAGIFGVARTFSPNYVVFCVMEFLDSLFQTGTYATAFILAVELVGPRRRVLAGIVIWVFYAFGEVLLASVAWLTLDWKLLSYALYVPTFLFVAYHWLAPESVRWLLSQKRFEEAEKILLAAAKVNKTTLSRETLDNLRAPMKEEPKEPLANVFKSKILMMRFAAACFLWITCAFLFYGLQLNSVALAGNNYFDFILISLVEIPALVFCYFTIDKIGRRTIQSCSFCITAVSCLAYIFIDERKHETVSLCFYLLGKFGATSAFTVIYYITSEIFPTPLRHSLMGACSMVGRIGSLVAPQVPLLAQIWTHLPTVLFSSAAMIAAVVTLSFPETVNIKLPDTIEEAEMIGKSSKPI